MPHQNNQSENNLVSVAVVQAHTIYGNMKQTLKKIEKYLREACSNGAQLVLFPEAFIGGYPRAQNFGSYIGVRTQQGREAFEDYHNQSIGINKNNPNDDNTPEVKFLCDLAKELKVIIVIGVIEHSLKKPRGSLYCTMLVIESDGTIIAKHRKTKPTSLERCIWAEGKTKTIDVHKTSVGNVGGLICWENRIPQARMELYKKNVEIYVAPTADGRPNWSNIVTPSIAYEGSCFVLSANQYGTVSDIYGSSNIKIEPSLGFNKNDLLYTGGSSIVNPKGETIAGPLWNEEGILYAKLDLRLINQQKLDWDVTGHYRFKGESPPPRSKL